jgi:hypothetical protein
MDARLLEILAQIRKQVSRSEPCQKGLTATRFQVFLGPGERKYPWDTPLLPGAVGYLYPHWEFGLYKDIKTFVCVRFF